MRRTALTIALVCMALTLAGFSAAAASASPFAPIDHVTFYNTPTGGSLLVNSADGAQTNTNDNTGSITITNATSGAVVFSKDLNWHWEAVQVAPGQWQYQAVSPLNDWWAFNSRDLPPGIYNYCAQVSPGGGYPGWSECQTHSVQANKLFSFGAGRNTSSGFRVPLLSDPALYGQQVQITVTRWRRVRRHRNIREVLGTPLIYQTMIGPGQLLPAGPLLRPNQRLQIALSFQQLSDSLSTTAAGDMNTDSISPTDADEWLQHWFSLNNCRASYRARITPRMAFHFEKRRKLLHPQLRGGPSICSADPLPL